MKNTQRIKKDAAAPSAAMAATAMAAGLERVPAEYRRERMDVAVGSLQAAPWNPRKAITAESVADLTASIRTVGIIEPLVAMAAQDGGDAGYVLISGHRRLLAAKEAGLVAVPCDVLVGIDAATAKRMTFIENLQRKDADPLQESLLVAELMADGMTIDEIASEIGRDRKWVMRRKNLVNLSPSWRKHVEDGKDITVDCLEHIAAYPKNVQEKCSKGDLRFDDQATRWCDVKHYFANESRDLKEAVFDCAKCLKCAKNSGCNPSLFDWDGGKEAELGKCLDAACYKRRNAEHLAHEVELAKAAGVTIVEGRPPYYAKTSRTKTRKCDTLYVWEEYYRNERCMAWSEAPKKAASAAPKPEMTAAEKAEREAEREAKKRRNKAIRRLAAWCAEDNHLARLLADDGDIEPHFPFLVQLAFVGIDDFRLIGTGTNKEDCAAMALLGTLHVRTDIWSEAAAAEILHTLDPSKNGGYNAEKNATLILALFDEAREALGEDMWTDIISPKGLQDFQSRTAKWLDPNADATVNLADNADDNAMSGEEAEE